MIDKNNLYKTPMGLTQQFRHCGNPFRIDSYKGCDFGCKYCFASSRGGNFNFDSKVADFAFIERMFKKAFENDKEATNTTIEMLRHRVPLHLGGMADPFQSRERQYKITYKLLELTKKYNYPMIISTKTAHIPEEYFEVLDPNIHAFQISLMSMSDEYIRKFETKTPLPNERKAFAQLLRDKGFWVSIRIQPLIKIEHAIDVVNEMSSIVNYITVEHIKIGNDNSMKKQLFIDMELDPKDFKSCGREYEFVTDIKKDNILKLKEISKCPIGCGDNDLHELSDSNNCCGVDTINENFNEWIKYNSMYINKTGDKNQWYPKCNCSGCFNSECQIKGYSFKDYVDDYMSKPPREGVCRLKLD